MKVVALVPLKLNNERLPGKNTKKFSNGRPLLDYMTSTLRAASGIDEVYLFCSAASVAEYATGGVKYLTRSESLDQSSTKINEVLRAFAEQVPADIYVLGHATAPFVKAEHVEEGVKRVRSGDYDSALSVHRLREFLWQDGRPSNYDLSNIPRTQDLPEMFVETSGFYVYTRDLIMRDNRRIGYNPYLIEIGKIEALDIDEPVDFEIADALVAQMGL